MRGMIVITVLAATFGVAAAATAQGGFIPIGHRQQANFSPCQWTQGGPPPIGTCNDTAPKVLASCNPAGISTLSITRSGIGNNFLQGTFTETVTATIGPQTGPPQSEIQVLASGIRNGSAGFPTGRLLSFNSTFSFQSYDSRTTLTGTKSLLNDLQNVGVCREFNNEVSGSAVFGSARLTGFFYLANAQVLNYAGMMTTDGVTQAVAGPAETYLANSFATSVGSGGTVNVNASTGHLATSFGTAHPALGSTWWTNTPVRVEETVTVRPAPGVTITFDRVSAPGNTTVRVVGTGDVPPLPINGSFLAGVPPALYEISTAATFTPPVTICVPYGGPAPSGTVPTLLHYEGGAWTDVATSYDELFRIVCGEVTSFSPFAAGYRPAKPVVTVPGPLQAEATSSSGASVTFDASALDAGQGTLPVTCSPASGNMFAVGNTLVTCAATDSFGYTTTESFTVTVQPAAAILTNTSPASAMIGGSLAMSATVAPAFATGTVTFTLGAQAVSAPVTGGIASATISPVQGVPGLSTLVISYPGDAAVLPATISAQVTLTEFVDPPETAPQRLLDLLAQYGAPQSLQSLAANLLRHVQAGNTGGACGNANAITRQLANAGRSSRLTSAQVLQLQLTLREATTLFGCR